ncbi:MAG: DUF456 family protein [Candidatus Thiodiazotropha sp.]
MKKLVLAMALSTLMVQLPVMADETAQAVDEQAFKGSWVGLLAGALVAGPPGAVLGFAGGAMIGELNSQQETLEAQLEVQRQSTDEARQALQTAASNNPQGQELLPVDLDALQQGFRFCLGFRTGSSAIEPRIAIQLQALAQMLRAFPQFQLQIDAGADQRGSEAYNQALSQERAEAVVSLLSGAGLSRTRMITRYQGESAARYPVEDLEGLAFDRMVQITLIPGGES